MIKGNQRIVILGGGFAGVRAALDISRRLRYRAQIILIDRNSYHLFTPALYEVATAYGVKKDSYSTQLRKSITIPLSEIFENHEVKFIQAEISSVSLSSKQVVTGGGEEIGFDYLVIALGSESSDFGIPGVAQYAYQFKNLEDGLMIHSKIENLFDEVKNGQRQLPIRMFVIGGGFTGVELSSELSTLLAQFSNQRKLNRRAYQISLFEAGPKIVPMASELERQYITQRLTDLGVIVMSNSKIEEVWADKVKLGDGRTLGADMIIWTAGVAPASFLKKIEGLPLTPKNKVLVDQHLRAKNFPYIFAAGDCVEYFDPTTGKPVAAMAYEAIRQGKVVASNIVSDISDGPLKPYRPGRGQWVIPVGGKFALAHLSDNRTVRGVAGWLIREAIDLKYLLSILPVPKAFSVFGSELVVFTKND